MGQEATLFRYFYDYMETRIRSGEIAHGETLPSIRSMCDMHNVGIRTVRDVMQKLKADGYVVSKPRIGYQVVYRKAGNADTAAHLLSKWDAAMDITKMLMCAFPEIMQNAAHRTPPGFVEKWRAALREQGELQAREQIRLCVAVFSEILSVYQNEYLNSLFLELNRFLEIPAIEGAADPGESIAGVLCSRLLLVLDLMEKGAHQAIATITGNMYSEVGYILNQYFTDFMRRYPKHTDYSATRFDWRFQRKREHRYIMVTHEIMKGIGDNTYPPKAFLPSMISLSKQYGVSSHTVVQAFDLLHKTGLITPHRALGNQVTPESVKPLHLADWHSAIAQELDRYLCSLHLLALLSRSVCALYFDQIAVGGRTPDDSKKIPPDQVMENLLENQPIKSLRTVCGQIMESIVWEHYFTTLWRREWKAANIGADLSPHPGAGERERFTEALQQSYLDRFLLVQKELVSCGYQRAGRLLRPDAALSGTALLARKSVPAIIVD